jgi:hypothetical protein
VAFLDSGNVGDVGGNAMGKASSSFFESLLKERCCLCVGAGATTTYVGSWKTLLGKLLGRRFVSAWLSEGQSFDHISRYINEDCFSGFFTEEGFLEIGEFLLADDSVPKPEGFTQSIAVWQELLFSEQVSDIIQRGISDALKKECLNAVCSRYGKCLMGHNTTHSYVDIYNVYKDGKEPCGFINKNFGTAMSLVEICLKSQTRHVITYNFDTVIEETLYEVIDAGSDDASGIRQIHIWTFGSKKSTLEVLHSDRCSVFLHQGTWDDGSKSLTDSGAIHFYHVHGVASGNRIAGESGQLVFSQHSYEVYQDTPLNWSNQVLQYLFSQYRVIAVGFSGTDTNFRYFASHHIKSEVNDFLFGKERDENRIVFLKAKQPYRDAIRAALDKCEPKRIGNIQDRMEERFLSYCTSMVENYYRNYYDISIKWVETYTDIARVLHKALSK